MAYHSLISHFSFILFIIVPSNTFALTAYKFIVHLYSLSLIRIILSFIFINLFLNAHYLLLCNLTSRCNVFYRHSMLYIDTSIDSIISLCVCALLFYPIDNTYITLAHIILPHIITQYSQIVCYHY